MVSVTNDCQSKGGPWKLFPAIRFSSSWIKKLPRRLVRIRKIVKPKNNYGIC